MDEEELGRTAPASAIKRPAGGGGARGARRRPASFARRPGTVSLAGGDGRSEPKRTPRWIRRPAERNHNWQLARPALLTTTAARRHERGNTRRPAKFHFGPAYSLDGSLFGGCDAPPEPIFAALLHCCSALSPLSPGRRSISTFCPSFPSSFTYKLFPSPHP